MDQADSRSVGAVADYRAAMSRGAAIIRRIRAWCSPRQPEQGGGQAGVGDHDADSDETAFLPCSGPDPPSLPGFTRMGRFAAYLHLEHAAEQLDILGQRAVVLHQLIDPANRVHDRRMVAPAELPADLGERS